MKMNAPIRSALMSALAVIACSFLGPTRDAWAGPAARGAGQDGTTEDRAEHASELVRISKAELQEFGVEVSVAGPGKIETYVPLPGEVRPNENRVAHIVPRYSGIVTDVLVDIGDEVRKGQVLAIVESDQSLAPYEVRTLISGTVISRHVTFGEAVSRDKDAFVIADLSTVWIDLTVYQRDVARIEVGQKVLIHMGHHLVEGAGIISYVTPVVDEVTRTATARIVLTNGDRSWRPGMFVTGKVLVEEVTVPVAIPLTAPQTLGEKTVVFVETNGGFEPRQVKLGRGSETHVEVLSGLRPGVRYVSRGGFTLKAELGKESVGEGHAD